MLRLAFFLPKTPLLAAAGFPCQFSAQAESTERVFSTRALPLCKGLTSGTRRAEGCHRSNLLLGGHPSCLVNRNRSFIGLVVTDVGGTRTKLAHGRENKKQAEQAFHEMLAKASYAPE